MTLVPFTESRRAFMTRLFALGAAARLWPELMASATARVANGQPAPAPGMIVRSVRPQDLETPLDRLNSWITPNEWFYVRSHQYTPAIDAGAWSLQVDGAVERSAALALTDLQSMPRSSVVATLECTGNGRAFFNPPVAGVQWERGAVGNARWTGVRLADVLKRAGVGAGAKFAWFHGGDQPVGKTPSFVRQLPIDRALHLDTLLAWEMNEAALPPSHGFPLRLVVPGWEAAYSVKWLKRIELSDSEQPGFWVQRAYRFPRRPVAPGAAADPDNLAPLTGLTVKSIITTHASGSRVERGPIAIGGFAWAGEADITRVDISVDGGSTWTAATLGREQARYAWRRFQYQWRADAGSHVVCARAADSRGRIQPIEAQWNPSGYLWNAIERIRIEVVTGDERPAVVDRSVRSGETNQESAGAEIFRRACTVCHQSDIVVQQRLTRAGWEREVDKMIGWGARLTPAERATLVDFLSAGFK